MSVKPPNPLDEAQELFEAGSVDAAATLFHRVRERARARGREDVRAEIDEMVRQMRGYLTGRSLRRFDELFAHGEMNETSAPRKTNLQGVAILLKIAGIALLGLYFLFWLGLVATETDTSFLASEIGVLAGCFVVLGGLAWLSLRHPLAAGALLIFPVTVPIGLFAGVFGDYAWLAICVGTPALSGVVLVAAGLVEWRTRR